MILRLALSCLLLVSSASSQCPSGCSCITETFVSCSLLTEPGFPQFDPAVARLVENLSIVGANISVLEASTLENFAALRSLMLWDAGIGRIEPGAFEPLQQTAITVNIQFNNILELMPGTFNGSAVSFRSLTLSSNQIETIHPGAFAGVEERGLVDLDMNALQTLPEGVLESSYATVFLGSNFECDCKLRWMPAYLNTTTTNLLGSCSSPADLAARALSSLGLDDLTCSCAGCSQGTCDTATGECQCTDGWRGENCTRRCAPGTHGNGCGSECSCEHSTDEVCHHVHGECFCRAGYAGLRCEKLCPNGTYGLNCSGLCTCANNATCGPETGDCRCTPGWQGTLCDQLCVEGRFGQGCEGVCSCEAGTCSAVDGSCTCPSGVYGVNCTHDCTAALDCATLNRQPCSPSTAENTCGPCYEGFINAGLGSSNRCTYCPWDINCASRQRMPCATVDGTCGPCYQGRITATGEGITTPHNETCFDPCSDSAQNYGETGVDCGGPRCQPCPSLGQSCTSSLDCGGEGRACLAKYRLPSGIQYEYDRGRKFTCVTTSSLGDAVLQRFRDAFQQRFALPGSLGLESRDEFLNMLKNEIQAQFRLDQEVSDSNLLDVEVSTREMEDGHFVYNVLVSFASDATSSEVYSTASSNIIANIHVAQLKATAVLSLDRKTVLFTL